MFVLICLPWQTRLDIKWMNSDFIHLLYAKLILDLDADTSYYEPYFKDTLVCGSAFSDANRNQLSTVVPIQDANSSTIPKWIFENLQNVSHKPTDQTDNKWSSIKQRSLCMRCAGKMSKENVANIENYVDSNASTSYLCNEFPHADFFMSLEPNDSEVLETYESLDEAFASLYDAHSDLFTRTQTAPWVPFRPLIKVDAPEIKQVMSLPDKCKCNGKPDVIMLLTTSNETIISVLETSEEEYEELSTDASGASDFLEWLDSSLAMGTSDAKNFWQSRGWTDIDTSGRQYLLLLCNECGGYKAHSIDIDAILIEVRQNQPTPELWGIFDAILVEFCEDTQETWNKLSDEEKQTLPRFSAEYQNDAKDLS